MVLPIINAAILFLILLVLILRLRKQSRPSAKVVSSEEDITTVLPIPLQAMTCAHRWEVLNDNTLEMSHEKKGVLVLTCSLCGVLDKTVQVTSPAPPPQPCRHEWNTQQCLTLDMQHEKKFVLVLCCAKCGLLDKTVEVTSEAPKACRHRWDVEKRVMLDSPYEQMLKSISTKTVAGKTKVETDRQIDLDLNQAPSWMFRKTYVSIRVCQLCGQLDKVICSNLHDSESEFPEEATTP